MAAAAMPIPPMPVPPMTDSSRGVRVAIVGCGHGELDAMYDAVNTFNASSPTHPIDLLLCCGDFQSVRNPSDLVCLACPPKYRHMRTFYKYYSGEKRAPVLTLFIGGNHEASNYLTELFHGGWVAPNIYYMGFASIVQFGGLRIGGLSGIFNGRHYRMGHYEHSPFDADSMRSVYHVREYEVWQLMQYAKAATAMPDHASAASAATGASSSSSSPSPSPIDIFLSHDWPRHIAHHGPKSDLLRRKKFLRDEIENGSLGSPPGEKLLKALQPRYWFAAHLHVKFPATVRHESKGNESQQPYAAPSSSAFLSLPSSSSSSAASSSSPSSSRVTRFLALDKCLPHREYLQLLDFPNATAPKQLCYDPVWLAIMKSTHAFLSTDRVQNPLPTSDHRHGMAAGSRWDFSPTKDELEWIETHVPRANDGSYPIPHNFTQTAPSWSEGQPVNPHATQPDFVTNPQTKQLLDMLHLPDVLTPAYGRGRGRMNGGHVQTHQYSHQQQQQYHTSSPSSHHPLKKQRTTEPLQSSSSANPEEIDIDAALDDDDVALDGAASAPSSALTNPDEIPLDDSTVPDEQKDQLPPVPQSSGATASGDPDEINIDDI